jgi:thymidylate synthase (FAD)
MSEQNPSYKSSEINSQLGSIETPQDRVKIDEIENILGLKFPLLDHGFIRVIDYMGSDSAVVQAARVSYGSGTKKLNEDRGLIRYLMRHYHTTPFEMCEIKFHIKAPIFVARQWLRHRTANVNEYSARYSLVEEEFYVPEEKWIGTQSSVNKQCRDQNEENEEMKNLQLKVKKIIKETSESQYDSYEEMLEKNIAREIARMSLTLNYYTEFYWKIDVHNLMHFIRLRADPHAQYEIRVYAEKMLEILGLWMPISHEAFLNYQKNSFILSEQMKNAIKNKLKGLEVTKELSGLSLREWNEFCSVFEI